MGIIDDVTWFAFASTLTVIGVFATWLLWRRRGAAAGLRALSFTLLPYAAYLTGTLKLVTRIADAIGSWAIHFVFSPTVWVGVALAGLAVVLFGASRVLGRHPGAAPTNAEKPAKAVATRNRPAAQAPPGGDLDDMKDIEAILKKHGIS